MCTSYVHIRKPQGFPMAQSVESTCNAGGTVQPKSWFPVHRCQIEILRQNLEEIEKSNFIIFARHKGNRRQASASRTMLLFLGEQGEVLYLLKVLQFFSLAKFQNGHSSRQTTQQLGLVSLKLSVHDLLSEMHNATREYGGKECQVNGIIYMKSESNQLCEGQVQLQVFASRNS